jgi:serine/threonine-protein kinase PBS1
MSCFPCFGGGKGNNDDADAESPGDAAPASNMTPPAMVQAPAAYFPAPAAAPTAAAPPKPGGGEMALSASIGFFMHLA